MTAKRPKKSIRKPELYWDDIVQCWFAFCREKKNESPSFDGSAPRDLRLIIIALRNRAISVGLEWTRAVALFRLRSFLEYAYQDQWLRDHWILFNINRQKDRIFYEIRQAVNSVPTNPFE